MGDRESGPGRRRGGKPDQDRMRRVIAKGRQAASEMERSYREQSLRIHPWVCARCGRDFTIKNLHLLTVHHKDHDHGNNPRDGSNWENLCVYCHENEHRRYLDHVEGGVEGQKEPAKDNLKHNPFAQLEGLLDKDGS